MTRPRPPRLMALAAGVATTALVAAGCTASTSTSRSDSASSAGSDSQASGGSDSQASGDDIPAALAQHLEKLRQSIPGNAGEPKEGPASAADQEFLQRAYPASTISVAKAQGATQAFRRAQARTVLGNSKATTGQWVNVGPTRALYPFTPLRNAASYVPNRYVAGGRTTDLAMTDTCKPGDCRMWVTPAGGGVWRTDDALAQPPVWTYLGGPLGINAVGSITVDPTDPTGNTIWVGTGEANICGSGCVAGVGLYKSTNGGNTWVGPLGKRALGGKGIGAIAIDPRDHNTIYAATTTALRGMSSVCCSGVTRPVPGAARWGLFKSTDGGHSWRLIHNGSKHKADCTNSADEFNNLDPCSPRGVRYVQLDPSNPDTVYASSFARGIWRSADAGRTWTQIKKSLNPTLTPTLAAFDVTTLANGDTRMYVYEGNIGVDYARLFRSDSVASGAPTFVDLTSTNPADPGYATYNQCGGQCWYDIFVDTPAGHPNMVYTGGSYAYGETGGISNGRAVVLSTDAGVSGTDMTMDGTDAIHPNGLHPDQHAIVTDPNRPRRFFEANDGGIMRSSGAFSDASSWCGNRGLGGADLTRCQQLLSKVPARLFSENQGLSTLQFQSLSVSPFDTKVLQGGTQDNGTWRNNGHVATWLNSMIGDGGQSGFDAKRPNFRFHTFYDASIDVNFDSGRLSKWIWTADPIYGQPGTQFYVPAITDPVVSGTMFVGTGSTVYRTTTYGLGNRTIAQAQRLCNEWTGSFTKRCGDWKPAGLVPLTSDRYGDRAGGAVAAIERTSANTSTAWAATTTGRVFITHNADAADPSRVSWKRIDDGVRNDPNRFVTSIHVDPKNPNRAWISYSGFSATTPTTPGHVFRVVYNNRRSRWTDVSANLADLPVNDLVRDDATGDLYAATDFGVLRHADGGHSWTVAARGMPNVEVAGLTIVAKDRVLYAASHGRSAFRLRLAGR